MAKVDSFDIIAIGGGTAGLVTAAGAAGLGARAALIERDRLGGDCLWTGCVPSKALVSSAKLAHKLDNAASFGLRSGEPVEIRAREVLASVRRARAQIQPHDDPARFRAMGVDVVTGSSARFVSEHEVDAGGRRMRARRFVIATGSRAAVPPIPGLEDAGYFTHAEAFDRDTIPRSLAVVGGGPIGVELAQAFRRLGAEVTIVEMLDRLLVREEPELADLLTGRLREEGIRIRTGCSVTQVERAGARRRVTISPQGASGPTEGGGPSEGSGPPEGGAETLEVDEILVAAGRTANTEGLGLDAAGVETSGGWIAVDSKLRTSRKRIFAAGDVTGGYLFTHVADHEARAVVQNALFPLRTSVDYSVIPWCTYADPELARVGLTEEEARDRHGSAASSHVYDLAGLDRAIVERAALGRVKIVAGRGGRILGGHILARNAGTMISEVALAMKAGVKLGALSSLVHPYPTMSEGVRRAADAYRRSLLTGLTKRAVDLALRIGRRMPA